MIILQNTKHIQKKLLLTAAIVVAVSVIAALVVYSTLSDSQ